MPSLGELQTTRRSPEPKAQQDLPGPAPAPRMRQEGERPQGRPHRRSISCSRRKPTPNPSTRSNPRSLHGPAQALPLRPRKAARRDLFAARSFPFALAALQ